MGTHRPTLARDHPCSLAFVDETGAISQDRFFAVGVVTTTAPSQLLRAVGKFRDQRHWYEEFKFSNVTQGSLTLYEEFIDVALGCHDVHFFSFVADRHSADPVVRFGDPWTAYLKMAEQLIVAVTRRDELVTVLADNYSTPDSVLFEEDLKASVNRRLKRLAVTSVARLDSRSSDGLQVVDMLTSAVAFEFRSNAGLAGKHNPKAQLSEHVRSRLGAKTCLDGWRNTEHSVQVYSHGGA